MATAQNVPPGVSGANQYSETLPGPGGNSTAGGGPFGGGGPSTGGGTSSGGNSATPKSTAQTLGAANARKLEALGPEGKAAAELATQSATATSSPRKAGHKGGQHAPQGSGGGKDHRSSGAGTSDARGSSGVSQVLSQITGTGGSDSGGMSWLLPLLIGASVVVAVAYLFARQRPPRPQD
jgi:hypothetical protein